jgi:hypothetical protein
MSENSDVVLHNSTVYTIVFFFTFEIIILNNKFDLIVHLFLFRLYTFVILG